jgi:hypothetical protein
MVKNCLIALNFYLWWDIDGNFWGSGLQPLVHEKHIHLQGRFSFAVPESVKRGDLRPLRNPDDKDA